jgi:hypothetical protein
MTAAFTVPVWHDSRNQITYKIWQRHSQYLHDMTAAHGNINIMMFIAILMWYAYSGTLAGSASWWWQMGLLYVTVGVQQCWIVGLQVQQCWIVGLQVQQRWIAWAAGTTALDCLGCSYSIVVLHGLQVQQCWIAWSAGTALLDCMVCRYISVGLHGLQVQQCWIAWSAVTALYCTFWLIQIRCVVSG